jgi:predicted DNA-binding protein with PD1-like motif
MKYRQIDTSPKTFIVVFQTGDELAKGLREFAEQQKLSDASFKAIGALSSVRLAWFSWESKKYEPSVTLDEQMELLSLIGDVVQKDGKAGRSCACRNRHEGRYCTRRPSTRGPYPPDL